MVNSEQDGLRVINEREIALTAFESSIEDRIIQFEGALKQIEISERVAKQFNGTFFFDGIRDGEKHSFEVDHQVIQAMKGATLGVYREMGHAGLEDMAKRMITARMNSIEK